MQSWKAREKGRAKIRKFIGMNRHRKRSEGPTEDLSGRLVTVTDPDSSATEAFRVLRTNLFYALVDEPPRVITVTSPFPREGKSTVCANLGVVLGQAEKNVLLLDCDFRKPVLHKVFGLRNLQGVVNVLAGERDLQEVLQRPLPGVNVVTVGPIPLNPSELLSSRRFAELLHRARQEFDYVLLDAGPVQLVADAAVVAAQGDGVLLCLDAQNTRKRAVVQSMRSLEAVGAKVFGTVMNNVKGPKMGPYYQRYSY
jgi:capsular exopolysaccharide synthesis family protein